MKAEGLSEEFLQRIESWAVQRVRQAGEMALDQFWRPLEVEYKQENRVDPVTEADRGIEAFLRSAILREFPDHAILGEEGTEVEVAGRDFVWVLDPVDGTTNFVNGLPLFACSAALMYHGEPVVGALFLPVAPRPARLMITPGSEARSPALQLRSAVLHARKGGGAFLDGDRVRATEAAQPESSSLAGLPGFHAHQFHRFGGMRRRPGEIRCLGSICYETAMVASGVFRYSLFRRPKVWDVAAGILLVREAGGLCLQWAVDHWEPLVRFGPMPNPKKPEERGFRFWSAITLMGGSQVVRYVSEGLRPRHSPRKPAQGPPME